MTDIAIQDPIMYIIVVILGMQVYANKQQYAIFNKLIDKLDELKKAFEELRLELKRASST